MKKLSVGCDSTLGNYRNLAKTVFGEDSPAVEFLDSKIEKSSAEEEVIADEGQMVHMLTTLHVKNSKEVK